MKNKYIHAISANIVYFCINSIAFLVITPASIKIMGVTFYGLWSIILSILILANIGTLGIGPIVTKIASEAGGNPHNDNEILSSGLIIVLPMALFFSLILFLFHNFIANQIQIPDGLHNDFSNSLIVCCLGLFPQFLNKVPQGYLLSKLRFSFVRFLDFLGNILPWIGALVISIYWKNLLIITWSIVVWQYFVLFFYYYYINKIQKFHFVINISIIKRMLNFSVFMFIESAAISMFQQLDKVIVSITLSPALAGVYSVGTSVGLRMSMISGQVSEVMVPFASLKDSLNDNETLSFYFRKMTKCISIIVGFVGSLLIIWINEILALWISPDYSATYHREFEVLLFAYSMISLVRPGHQTITGLGKVKFTSLIYMTSTILMLVGLYFFSKRFGLIGAAFANILMIILLIYDLKSAKILCKNLWLKNIILDLFVGIFLPLLSLFYIHFFSSYSLKSILTLVITVVVISVIRKDNFFYGTFLKFFKNFFSDKKGSIISLKN